MEDQAAVHLKDFFKVSGDRYSVGMLLLTLSQREWPFLMAVWNLQADSKPVVLDEFDKCRMG
jgi:hypothetical protein